MQTRDRILASALNLYNLHGVSTITSRHIALDLKMSAGNLHYHFKRTEDIINALYKNLLNEFDTLFSNWEVSEIIDGTSLNAIIRKSFGITYKYRFAFIYVNEVAKKISTFKEDHRLLKIRREKQFNTVFEKLSLSGHFKSNLSEYTMSDLVTQLFIISDFYLSYNSVTQELNEADALIDYTRLIESLFFPYLAASPL